MLSPDRKVFVQTSPKCSPCWYCNRSWRAIRFTSMRTATGLNFNTLFLTREASLVAGERLQRACELRWAQTTVLEVPGLCGRDQQEETSSVLLHPHTLLNLNPPNIKLLLKLRNPWILHFPQRHVAQDTRLLVLGVNDVLLLSF